MAAAVDPRFLQNELASLHEASFAWAMLCCSRNRSTAEDVLQEVYFKILDGRARYEQRSALKTWLFGVIRLTAREEQRFSVVRLFRGKPSTKEQPAQQQQQPIEDKADSQRRAPDSEAAHRENARLVANALTQLADRQREILHLVFYEDLSISEAAIIMGVALGTARQHYERGKSALSAILGPVLDPNNLHSTHATARTGAHEVRTQR